MSDRKCDRCGAKGAKQLGCTDTYLCIKCKQKLLEESGCEGDNGD